MFTFHRLGGGGPALEQGYNKLSEKNGSTVEYKHEELVLRGGRGEIRKKRGEIRKKSYRIPLISS